jgi:outer membrane protein
MKKALLSFTLLTLSSFLYAQESYTVDELILQSLENSPDLHISKLQYDASQKRYDTAFSGYLPQVDLTASAGRISQSETYDFSSVDDNLLTGKISLKQLLYDFGKTGGDTDTEKFSSQSYLMENMQKISDKKKDVKNAYYDILKAIALIDVQKENVKLNKAQLYRAKRYFEAGIRTKIDISDAEFRLIKAKLELKKAEYNLKLSYAQLDKVVGFAQTTNDYTVYSQKLELQTLYNSLHPYDLTLEEAINFAYLNRYEIKKEFAKIKSTQAQTASVDAQYYPSLFLSANYIAQKADEYQLYVPKTKWDAMLNLNWNLYQGGATSAQSQEKKINLNISNEQLSYTKLTIKKSTTMAFINLNKTKDTIELDQSLVKVSNEKFDQASKRYEHGLSDYIELQEARQGYIDAKATLVVDYYNYYIAIATLDNAIGK